jgi:hypothetical protein
VSLKSAPRRATWLGTEGTTSAIRTLSLPSAAEPLTGQPARPGNVSAAGTPSRKEQSAPPTERTSARTGVGTQRRPGPAILAGPLRRRTGTAAKTAAAQVGKRCQLSNGTRHGYIIAPTYDNAPGRCLACRSLDFPPGLTGQQFRALWPGAGSNRRPTAFQLDRSERCATTPDQR